MVGTLNSNQTRLLNMIRGEIADFPFECDGRRYALMLEGKPRHGVEINGDDMILTLGIRLNTIDDVCARDASSLEREIERALTDVVQVCQRMGSEPFGFAEDAAASFLTLNEWQAFDWRTAYERAPLRVNVEIHSPDAT